MSGSVNSKTRDERRRSGELRRALTDEIAQVVGSPREARWIVEEVWSDPSEGTVRARALVLAQRRASGEPLQHVLGHWGFRYLDVAVDGRALVPRPETEVLVGFALDELAARGQAAAQALNIADLGTGSGVIACALASELSSRSVDYRIFATDASSEALNLAAENIDRTIGAAGDILLLAGSWFAALPPALAGALDMIVSNPPYLGAAEWSTLDPVVRDHDPYPALVAGPTGLEVINELIDESPAWLTPEGILVIEIAPDQAVAVVERAERAGFSRAEVRPDLTERPRVLVARR
ncbi:MAG: peptide chain release factor N(5)-glutamine methyltransferase [Acidimicrobiales bacterium]